MSLRTLLKKAGRISLCSSLNSFYAQMEKLAGLLEKHSVNADFITLTGLFFAVLGVNFLAIESYFSAFFCLVFNRLCDILDGVVARRRQITAFGAFFDIVIDYFSLALFIFGFALAIPEKNAVASAFWLLTFTVSVAVLLGLLVVSKQNYHKLNQSQFKICLWGTVQNFDTSLALFLMCICPFWFMPLALFFGIISLGKSLLLISGAYYSLVIAAGRGKRK